MNRFLSASVTAGTPILFMIIFPSDYRLPSSVHSAGPGAEDTSNSCANPIFNPLIFNGFYLVRER